MNEAAQQALKDISDDYKDVRQTYYTDANGVRCIDTWFVGGTYLYTVENRELNRRVGAAYLNSGGYRGGSKNTFQQVEAEILKIKNKHDHLFEKSEQESVDGWEAMRKGILIYLKK